MMNTKVLIRKILCETPLIGTLFYRYYVYRAGLDEKTLRGKIQLMGHRVDLHLTENKRFPASLLAEFSFLINEAFKRKLVVDASLAWAIKMFYMTKYNLIEVDTEDKTTANEGSEPACQNECIETIIKGRRSVRKWVSGTIDIDEVMHIIDVAKWAPSSCNRQTWQVLIIDNIKDMEFLGGFFGQEFWKKASVALVVLVNAGVYGLNEKHYAYLDGAAFIQTMLLMLHAKGYGACWMGFSRWNTRGDVFDSNENYEKFYQYFNLQKQQVPISMIVLGRPAADVVPPPRQDISNIVINKQSV